MNLSVALGALTRESKLPLFILLLLQTADKNSASRLFFYQKLSS